MTDDRYGEKVSIQMQLSRLYDEWMISVTNSDLEASDRVWLEMDVIYKKLRNYLSPALGNKNGK